LLRPASVSSKGIQARGIARDSVWADAPGGAGGPPVAPAVVWLSGEHDLSTVLSISQALATAVASSESDLVIDLSGVTFMDASTMRVIDEVERRLHEQSRTLRLRAPSRCARRLRDLCQRLDALGTAATRAPPSSPRSP
jgi:anti-sigma B factor antagonist